MAKKKALKHDLEDVTLVARGLWVLVKPIPKKSKKTKSGLVEPDNVEKEQKSVGKVISAGGWTENIKKGDKVVYGMFSGETIEVTEKGKAVEYMLVKDEDIVAFVR